MKQNTAGPQCKQLSVKLNEYDKFKATLRMLREVMDLHENEQSLSRKHKSSYQYTVVMLVANFDKCDYTIMNTEKGVAVILREGTTLMFTREGKSAKFNVRWHNGEVNAIKGSTRWLSKKIDDAIKYMVKYRLMLPRIKGETDS